MNKTLKIVVAFLLGLFSFALFMFLAETVRGLVSRICG